MENTLKKTALNAMHYEMGAKMVPFAGFDMPVQFEGVNVEHETVRKGVGVFDVSHMGEFRAKGPKAFALVQRCTSNDVAALVDGKVQYTCLPNGKGGIVDDMLVYRVSADEYFMVPNAANIDKDWAWMSKVAEEMGMKLGVDFINESNQWSQLAVQGPLALKAMQKLTKASVADIIAIEAESHLETEGVACAETDRFDTELFTCFENLLVNVHCFCVRDVDLASASAGVTCC